MSAGGADEASILFGTTGQISVSRGLAEFHARRPVLVAAASETLLALPVEGLDAQRLAAFVKLCAPAVPQLVITARRAVALGLTATTPMALQLNAHDGADKILCLVANAKTVGNFDARPAGLAASAAIQLVKLSHGLPAVLIADVAACDTAVFAPQVVTVAAEAVARFRD